MGGGAQAGGPLSHGSGRVPRGGCPCARRSRPTSGSPERSHLEIQVCAHCLKTEGKPEALDLDHVPLTWRRRQRRKVDGFVFMPGTPRGPSLCVYPFPGLPRDPSRLPQSDLWQGLGFLSERPSCPPVTAGRFECRVAGGVHSSFRRKYLAVQHSP